MTDSGGLVTREEVERETVFVFLRNTALRLLAERDAFEKVAIAEQLLHFKKDTGKCTPEELAACVPESRESVRKAAFQFLNYQPSPNKGGA